MLNIMSTLNKNLTNQDRLNNVVASLERVPMEIKQSIFDMASNMSEAEIIQNFNQNASDSFNKMIEITTRLQKEKEYNMKGYKVLFDRALKINAKLPVDQFTLIILEYAAEIYAEEEDCFLNMTIPDVKLNVNNQFGFIRSEMFKKLWRVLGNQDKEDLKERIILLTSYAHAYLYKTLLLHNK